MATTAGAVIGNALLPGLGGIIGASLGAVIDQTLISALQDPVSGPRLDDKDRVRGFDEGAGRPWVFGGPVRVPGQVVYMSDRREIVFTEGGGKGPDVQYYEYFYDVAVMFAENECEPANPVTSIWIGGKELLNVDNDQDKTSSDVTVTAQTTPELAYYVGSTLLAVYTVYEDVVFTNSGTAPGENNFFAGFNTGLDVEVSGCDNTINNGTFYVMSVEVDADGVGGKSRLRARRCSWQTGTMPVVGPFPANPGSCPATIPETAGGAINFLQDVPDFSAANFESITQYNGDESQVADPVLEANEGAGVITPFRGSTVVVIKNLNVTKWGGNIPKIEGLVTESSTQRTVAQAIEAVCTRHPDVDASMIDTSGVSGDFDGMVLIGPKSPVEVLRHIMFVYDVGVQEKAVIDGDDFVLKLFFFDRENAESITVLDDDRGCREEGSSGAEKIKMLRKDSTKLVGGVTVKFQDRSRQYQEGSRSYPNDRLSNQYTATLSMVLDPDAAAKLTKRAYWIMRNNDGVKLRMNLPPSYVHAIEGDTVLVNDAEGRARAFHADTVDRGANGMLEVEGSELLVGDVAPGQSGGFDPEDPGIALTIALDTIVTEIPPLTQQQANIVTIINGIAPSSPDDPFNGAAIMESLDRENSWNPIINVATSQVIGRVEGTVGGGASHNLWDDGTTVTVVLSSGEVSLSSANESLVKAGSANWMLVGNEIIGFVHAALVAPRTYELTRLLRGRRNTERHIDNHFEGERCMLLTARRPKFYSVGLAGLGSLRFYKGVPTGGAEEDVPYSIRRFVTGESVLPFSPTFQRVTRNSTGDWDIYWRRRTRVPFRTFSGASAPVFESKTEWFIVWRDESDPENDTLIKGDDVITDNGLESETNAKKMTLTSARMTALWGGTPSTLNFDIYQWSDALGFSTRPTKVRGA